MTTQYSLINAFVFFRFQVAWSRVEVPWALVDLELTQLDWVQAAGLGEIYRTVETRITLWLFNIAMENPL